MKMSDQEIFMTHYHPQSIQKNFHLQGNPLQGFEIKLWGLQRQSAFLSTSIYRFCEFL